MFAEPILAAEWNDTNCTNRGGTIVSGTSGDTFCYSKRAMNWWSANVWCQKHGGVLSDYQTACNLSSPYAGAPCPNLVAHIPSGDYWLTEIGSNKKPVHYNQGYSNNLYYNVGFSAQFMALCKR